MRTRRAIAVALGLLVAWIAFDLYAPRHSDFRVFNAAEMGRLDAAMWRSYYERKPIRLFGQLARSLRVEFHAGLWRSYAVAYRAAKAAFAFKDGHSRQDYLRALPDLERYFASVSALSIAPFDAHAAARDELEWWIIRREPQRHTPADWERLVGSVAATVYQRPIDRFAEYSRLRVAAMVLRDQRGSQITESDWSRIGDLLQRSWTSLGASVQ